jgi:hypothetical protein
LKINLFTLQNANNFIPSNLSLKLLNDFRAFTHSGI